MPEQDKPKIRLGDDGELYEYGDPLDKPKRKTKTESRPPTPVLLALVIGLLLIVGCLLSLNLLTNIGSRLARNTPVAVAPSATPIPPSATPTLPPSATPAPTATPTPTLVITPPTLRIGERPLCTGITGTQRIVFDTVYGDDNREIYLLDLTLPPGDNICRLTNDARTDADPVWHPNGRSVLFNRADELWRVNVDGSGLTTLLRGSDGQWDNTGDWIVFAAGASPNDMADINEGNLGVAAADGSQRRPITSAAQWDDYAPDCCSLNFSALLPVIVFASAERDGTRPGTSDPNAREIFTINADGSGRTRLTFNDEYDDEPEWSPGGNQIVLTRGRYGFNTDIWIMNADGSNPIQLTSGEATDHSPRWLPDGRIMFVSERERAGAIYVMNADGSNVSPITAPVGVLTFDYWSG